VKRSLCKHSSRVGVIMIVVFALQKIQNVVSLRPLVPRVKSAATVKVWDGYTSYSFFFSSGDKTVWLMGYQAIARAGLPICWTSGANMRSSYWEGQQRFSNKAITQQLTSGAALTNGKSQKP
jgi:hypothetical protein